jgi:predicted permease
MTGPLTAWRLAARSLLAVRGFTSAAVLTLALGITLCTTAMAVVGAYLLDDLPYPAADRLYWIRYGVPGAPNQDQPRNTQALDWASLDDVIEHPVAWDLDVFYMLGDQVESSPGAWVTPGFVQGLGIQPAVGRGFEPAAFAAGAPNVALISHRLWHARFGGDPGIVGRTFTAYVSDRPEEAEQFTVIGVMPERFWHLNTYTDILTPLRAPTFPYMARLRAGVTPEVAASRITALVKAGSPSLPQNWTATVVSAHDVHVQSVRPILRAVSLAAGLVLLVACANVAGLLLVRTTKRQREMAVRTALGAGPGAIARMLLVEGLILGVAASVLALLLTRLTLDGLAPTIQQQLGRSAPGGPFAIDLRTMGLAAGAAILTALMCALVPLAALVRARVSDGVHLGSRTMTEGTASHRVRASLIATQVALSLTLLSGSTLMLRSVMSLLDTNLGFTADRILNASITLRQNRYPDPPSRVAAFERIAAQLGSLPGVESVGLTTAWPVQQPSLQAIERRDAAGKAETRAVVQAVSDGYFATLSIPITAGRSFAPGDRAGSAPVAIVSATLARQLWPSGALGQRVAVPERPLGQERGEPVLVERQIVGVVADVRQGPTDVDLADLYVPIAQTPTRFAFVLTRTAGAPSSWLAPLRSAIREIDPELAVDRARPLQLAVDEVTARPRFLTALLGAFAAIAGLLALVGVYGVIAYAVRQREREIAVRLAIGADPSRITRLFLRQGAVILVIGLGLGVLGVLAAGRVIESQLFGVTPRDPLSLAFAVLAFAAAGLAAIWWPARRAGALDPAIALRAE